MDYLPYLVGVLAVTSVYLWYSRNELRRQYLYHRRLAHAEFSDRTNAAVWMVTRTVERLALKSKPLPPIDFNAFEVIESIFDDEGIAEIPAECINEYMIRWTKTIDELTDNEIFLLWINGVLEYE